MLASISQQATLVCLTSVLTLIESMCAVTLAVTLYALTRDEDPSFAMLALCCPIDEGVVGAFAGVRTLGLLSVATASTVVAAPDAAQRSEWIDEATEKAVSDGGARSGDL
ncbi:MAG TPA: DUF4386 family protein [Terriglobales bacterium]|nr:DUF4386 family protein [Terriglobales bacterium]